MSLLIHYENGVLKRAERLFARMTPSPVYAAKDGKTFVVGEVFEASYEDVVESGWQENPEVLNRFEAALSIVSADKSGCAFATDLNGIESLYTYHNKGVFILSDDFWDIVKLVQPTYEDLNTERVRGFLLYSSINGDTPIQNLKTVFPFTIGKYDPITDTLSVKRYMKFQYSGEIIDVDEAVERMDRILDRAMKNVKEVCGDVTYGIGVSGGLDSRVLPHYAKKNGMKITGFNVCVPKPYGILTARSCKVAKEVAQAFDMPYENTRWNPETVEEKIYESVRCYPLCSGRNSFKYEPKMPAFEALLTGASGLVVGSMLPKRINQFSREELISEMVSFFNREENGRTFFARAARGLNYIFGTKFNGSRKSVISELISSDDIKKAQDAMIAFIDNGIQNAQTNLEIYEDFFSNVLGFRNRYGAYESIFGKKRSFSIYIPFLYKETLKWSPDLLFDRVVLKRLIVDMIPEVKDVRCELFEPAPGQKLSLFNKLINMVDFVVRGNGAAVDDYWMKKRSVKKKLAARLDNGCEWFEKVFQIDSKQFNAKLLKSGESELMINVWELKTLLDFLETKEYLNFN